MMNKLKCFKVICRDDNMNTHEVGVMAADEFSAKHCAEHSLFEGQHIRAKAIDAIETDSI